MEIVMRQVSGLGNQLFQYAACLYYAQRYGASVRMATELPRNAVSHGYSRPFLLQQFRISVPTRTLTARERLLFSGRPALQPAAALFKHRAHIQIFHEPITERYTFIPDIPLNAEVRTLYLVGYWQAYRVVDCVADQLRQDLRFRNEPTGRNLELLHQIARSNNSVSLHVRRGDYTLAAEGNIALPLPYYTRAIEHFQQKLTNPTFFVFSDDIPYTRQHLPAGIRAVFVDHNDDASSHEDLRLMSACRHHIIANSSFSWWGAWLNPRPNKTIYAPKYWHLKPESYFPDLLPPNWMLASF